MPEIRDYIFLEMTRSICPVCQKTVDAQVRVREEKVYMFKRCPQHGEFEGLISSDINFYRYSLAFNKPGQIPKEFTTQVNEGCPKDCGLCPEHQQHTCLAVLEVTDNCNLSCACCYAGVPGGKYLDLNAIDFMLNRYVACEGHPEVLQISGGEPTLHPQIFEIIDLAKSKNIHYVMLNTNGIRLAQDMDFVKRLSQSSIELYLQFDGFGADIYEKIRGDKAVWDLKQHALEQIAHYRIPTTLVTTLIKGVNDDQIGKIIDFAVKNRYVRGITFQPIAYVNEQLAFDPMDRLTLPDVIKGIETQTNANFKASDFVPLPCSYPTCCSLTYAFIKDGKPIPVTRQIEVEKYLDYFSNRIMTTPASILRKALEGLWSASATLSASRVLKDFNCVCGINFAPGALDQLKENVLRIVVKPFMDGYTFDIKRAMKCCIHVLRPDGKMIPFCVHNNIYRDQKS